MFSQSQIISAIGTAAGQLESVVETAITAAGGKADVMTKVQAGMEAVKAGAADLSATLDKGAAQPIIQKISDGFVAVDNGLGQLPLGAREAQIVQIAGFVIPMLLNAARVIWH